MKRLLLIFGILVLSAALPRVAHAQIVPSCDKTVYVVTQGGWLLDVDPKRPDEHVITPELYNQNPAFFSPGASAGESANISVTTTPACGFNDFVQLFVNIINWAFSFLVIISSFFFIWGGFTLLIAGGRSEFIEGGKKTIQGTIVGILIVLTAYIIVNFYVQGLIGDSTATFLGKEVPNPLAGESCQKTFKDNTAMAGRGSQNSCRRGNLIFGCTDTTKNGSVHEIQRLLNKKCGGICGDENGCYGNQTAHCVRMFQLANLDRDTGVPLVPTGEVDAGTWASIQDPDRTDCFTTRKIIEPGEDGVERIVKMDYPNPVGIADFQNAFPITELTKDKAFGSCAAPGGFACLPAHAQIDCPSGVVKDFVIGSSVDVSFDYVPMSCAWIASYSFP